MSGPAPSPVLLPPNRAGLAVAAPELCWPWDEGSSVRGGRLAVRVPLDGPKARRRESIGHGWGGAGWLPLGAEALLGEK